MRKKIITAPLMGISVNTHGQHSRGAGNSRNPGKMSEASQQSIYWHRLQTLTCALVVL